jgi:hypothetical protein
MPVRDKADCRALLTIRIRPMVTPRRCPHDSLRVRLCFDIFSRLLDHAPGHANAQRIHPSLVEIEQMPSLVDP